MKKIIFLAAFVIFLIIVGMVPLLVGISFKHHYLDFIAATNQKNQQKIKIALLDYKRGWFSSTATIQITPVITSASEIMKRTPVMSPEQVMALTTVTLVQTISHGPIVMDKINNHPTMAMAAIQNILHSSDVEKLLYGGTKTHGLLEMNSVFNFSNECTNRIILPAFQYSFPEKGSLAWQGLTTDIFFHLTPANEIDAVKTQTKIGTLVIKSETVGWEGNFTLQPISAQSSTALQSVGLWTGESEIRVPAATLNTPSESVLDLDKLTISSEATLPAKNLYQLSSALTINKLIVPSWSINTISGFNFKLNFDGLNANELVNLIRLVNQYDLLKDKFEDQYIQSIIRVITPSTKINLTSASDTSLGRFNLNALLYWPAAVPAPQTPEDVYANGSAKIDIRMSILLAKELIKISANNIAERSSRQIAVTPPATTPALTVDMAPQADSAKNAFSQYIAGLLRAGKVSLSSSLQIMSWWDQQLPADVFATNLKQLGLGLDTESGLVQNYTQLKKSAPAPVPAQPVSVQAATTAPQTQEMKDQMQQLLMGNILATIDDWLKQGYLIQDGNDYVTSITREAGVIKVNGKDLPPEIANMAAPALSTVPSAAQ